MLLWFSCKRNLLLTTVCSAIISLVLTQGSGRIQISGIEHETCFLVSEMYLPSNLPSQVLFGCAILMGVLFWFHLGLSNI